MDAHSRSFCCCGTPTYQLRLALQLALRLSLRLAESVLPVESLQFLQMHPSVRRRNALQQIEYLSVRSVCLDRSRRDESTLECIDERRPVPGIGPHGGAAIGDDLECEAGRFGEAHQCVTDLPWVLE